MLDEAEAQGIVFIPWFPLAAGPLAAAGGPLHQLAAITTRRVASGAGLVAGASPVMLPIPGTSKVAHLEQNVAAAEITLSDDEFETLSKAGAETD